MDTSMQDPSAWERVEVGALSLALPPNWTLELSDAGPLLLHPEVGEFFRPNMVVRHAKDDRPIEAISAQSIQAELRFNPGAHYLHADAQEWVVEGTGTLQGRHHRFAYTAGGWGIVVNRWLIADGENAWELVGSCSLIQTDDMEPTFAAVAGSVVPGRDALQAAGSSGSAAPTDGGWRPRLDTLATARDQAPRETWGGLHRAARFSSEGPVLSYAAMDVLTRSAELTRLPRLMEPADQPAVDELRSAGLIDQKGRFSERLKLFLAPIRDASFAVHVTGMTGGTPTSMTCWIGDGTVLVAAGPSRDQLLSPVPDGVPNDRLQLDLLSGESVPAEIAAWAGLLPAWHRAGTSMTLDPDEYGRAVQEGPQTIEGTLPDDRMVTQPWFQWSVAIDPLGPVLDLTGMGEAGQYLTDFSGTPLTLQAVSTDWVWTTLSQTYLAALAGLPSRAEREERDRG